MQDITTLPGVVGRFVADEAAITERLSAGEEPTKMACLMMLRTLKELYGLQGQPHWSAVRDSVRVSGVKELKGVANTSVTSGVVLDLGRAHAQPDKPIVYGVLNCGTGGVRVQGYRRDEGRCRVLFELKPDNFSAPSAAPNVAPASQVPAVETRKDPAESTEAEPKATKAKVVTAKGKATASKSKAKAVTEPKARPEAEPKAEPKAEAEPKAVTEAKAGLQAEAKAEPKAKAETKAAPPSLSDLKIPGMSAGDPEVRAGTLTARDLNGVVLAEVAKARKEIAEQGLADAPLHLCAVVTGPIRADYFKASDTQKLSYQLEIAKVFANTGVVGYDPSGSQFFMPQEAETRCEYLATANILRFVDPALACVASFGVGRGSAQFGNADASIGIPFGMNTPQKMMAMTDQVRGEFKCEAYVSQLKPGELPTICLKSGCLIYLETASTDPEAAALKARLFRNDPDQGHGAPTVVIHTAAGDQQDLDGAAAAAAIRSGGHLKYARLSPDQCVVA